MSKNENTASTPSRLRRLVRVLAVVAGLGLLALFASWGVVWYRERPLREAERALARGEPKVALQVTSEFLRDHPENSRAVALRARALVATGDASTALRLFNRIGPASAEDLHAMARAYLMLRQWSQALPLLVRFLQLEPADPDGLYEITACRAQLGMLQEALESARRFAELPGHEARGHLFRGTIHSDLGNFTDAVAAYQQVLKFNPDARNLQVSRQEFLREFARLLQEAGRPEESVAYLERVNREEPTAAGFYLLGNARQSGGELDPARQAWRRALELDSTFVAAREALAGAALEDGDARSALNWLTPLEDRTDMAASTAYLFQRAHTLQGDAGSADRWRERLEELRAGEKREAAISALLREAPRSFWAQVVRAHQFAAEGNWSQAEVLLQTLAHQEPHEPFYRELVEAVRQRSELPPLDKLPIRQF